MEIDKDKILYYLGTTLIVFSVLLVTILPFIINTQFPHIHISPETYKKITGVTYIFAFLCYANSPKFIAKQTSVILLIFLFYIGFQYIAKFY